MGISGFLQWTEPLNPPISWSSFWDTKNFLCIIYSFTPQTTFNCEFWLTSFELLSCYVSYHRTQNHIPSLVEERPRTHSPPRVPLPTSLWPPSSLPIFYHLLTVGEEWGKGWNETSRKVKNIGWRWKCQKWTSKFPNWQVRRYNIPWKPTIDPIGGKILGRYRSTHGTSMDMNAWFLRCETSTFPESVCCFWNVSSKKRWERKVMSVLPKKPSNLYMVGLYLKRLRLDFCPSKAIQIGHFTSPALQKHPGPEQYLDLFKVDPCNGGIWC